MTDKRWLKPFSTGLSCFDTVDGECLTTMETEEECERYCSEHPFCDQGYFVEYADRKYCVPLNGLTAFGGRNAFDHSLFPPNESIFFHPDIGVSMHVFQGKKNIPSHHFPSYTHDPFIRPTLIMDTVSGKYLRDDLTLTDQESDASTWQIFRFLYDFSGVNSNDYDRISNGEIISIRSVVTDRALVFHNGEFKMLPASALMGFSPTYSYENVYYFQLFQGPDATHPIDPEKPFSIRINTLPVRTTYFLTLRYDSLQAEQVENIVITNKYQTWRLLPTLDDHDASFPTSLFVKSQWDYARDYLGASLEDNHTKNLRRYILFLLIGVLLLLLIRVYSKTRPRNR